jgi:hypothetical protein
MSQDPSTTVNYENVCEKLVEHVPDVKEKYEAELKWWSPEKPGAHVVYGDILNPYLAVLLQSGDEATLRRVFDFLEVLSRSEDPRVQELVAVTVCEYLGSDSERLREASRFMGPATLKHSREVEKFWSAS